MSRALPVYVPADSCYDTERLKKERERERKRLRRLTTKITRERERESNKEGRGIIKAIRLDRHRSRLIGYYILKRGTIFLFAHGVFVQLSLD